jgi:hypothetical protein
MLGSGLVYDIAYLLGVVLREHNARQCVSSSVARNSRNSLCASGPLAAKSREWGMRSERAGLCNASDGLGGSSCDVAINRLLTYGDQIARVLLS